MNKLQQIINNKWFLVLFFSVAISISIFQHYRVFSLDIIGYHSWRQTQTQTVIDNFANEDFRILNPRVNDLHYEDRIIRMEFPLAQWIIAALNKLFGNHLLITRLFFFITTLFSCLGIYRLIIALTRHKLSAALTAWFFLFSPVIYFYSVNPLPDNLALCFGIWMLVFWIRFIKENRSSLFIISCVFFALSLAVKLPFILFGAVYLSRFYDNARRNKLEFKYLLLPFCISLLPLIWYACVIGTWQNNGVVQGIILNTFSLAKLWDIFFFNTVSTLPELLINYATFPLFVVGIYYTYRQLNLKDTIHRSFFYAGCLCIAYFLYELNMIDKVHDYYLFPFMPFIFIIIAKAIDVILSTSSKWKYLILVSLLVSPVTAYLRCNSRWNTYTPGFSREYLFYKKQLQSLIPDTAKVIVYGDDSRSIVLYHLNRKGWSYGEHDLNKETVDDTRKAGAKYLVSDCEIDISKFVTDGPVELLFTQGNVKLYKLK